MVRVETNIL